MVSTEPGQMTALLTAMGTSAGTLLPEGTKIQDLYDFVLNGGNGFDGINNYLSNITAFRNEIPL
jgi:hypothetical protein